MDPPHLVSNNEYEEPDNQERNHSNEVIIDKLVPLSPQSNEKQSFTTPEATAKSYFDFQKAPSVARLAPPELSFKDQCRSVAPPASTHLPVPSDGFPDPSTADSAFGHSLTVIPEPRGTEVYSDDESDDDLPPMEAVPNTNICSWLRRLFYARQKGNDSGESFSTYPEEDLEQSGRFVRSPNATTQYRDVVLHNMQTHHHSFAQPSNESVADQRHDSEGSVLSIRSDGVLMKPSRPRRVWFPHPVARYGTRPQQHGAERDSPPRLSARRLSRHESERYLRERLDTVSHLPTRFASEPLQVTLVSTSAANTRDIRKGLAAKVAPPVRSLRQTKKEHPVEYLEWIVPTTTEVNTNGYPKMGEHHGTSTIFYSSSSVFVLVWDLAFGDPDVDIDTVKHQLERNGHFDACDESDFDHQVQAHVERGLRRNLVRRVLRLFDHVAAIAKEDAVILLAAKVPPHLTDDQEVLRRCQVMQTQVDLHALKYYRFHYQWGPVVSSRFGVVPVSKESGVRQLRSIIAKFADENHTAVSTQNFSRLFLQVEQAVHSLRERYEIVLLCKIQERVPSSASVEEIVSCLERLSSAGKVFFYGSQFEANDILSQFVVLSKPWLQTVLRALLQDWQLTDHRVAGFCGCTSSNCPLLSESDLYMLWAKKPMWQQTCESLAEQIDGFRSKTLLAFLQSVLKSTGTLIPLNVSNSTYGERTYFAPALLTESCSEVWSYMEPRTYRTTLCNSWLFRDGVPPRVKETVMASILQNIYKLSTIGHDEYEQIIVHELMCWKKSMKIRVGAVFADKDGSLVESTVDVFVAVVDESSCHSVAASIMTDPRNERIVVSGKGVAGQNGKVIWDCGYKVAINSVRQALGDESHAESQVVCPKCLALFDAKDAATWTWNIVHGFANGGNPSITCHKGHHVNSYLVHGEPPSRSMVAHSSFIDPSELSDTLPSVVLVMVVDTNTGQPLNIGSGFIADEKLGLVVTAGHVLYDINDKEAAFKPYFEVKGAKTLIGVISPNQDRHNAVFRYVAEVVSQDIRNVDAAVLRITGRLAEPVSHKSPGNICAFVRPDIIYTGSLTDDSDITALGLSSKPFAMDEDLRIVGFNQEGEGLLPKGRHINYTVGFTKGHTLREFTPVETTQIGDKSDKYEFIPRSELVANCESIALSGQSGGPCVNNENRVIGILSRNDKFDQRTAYLVPAKEISLLLEKAKRRCEFYSTEN